MFGVFAWLRQQAKNAVLAGVADAAEELETVELPAPDVEGWRKKLAEAVAPKALPAKDDDDKPKGRKAK